MVLFTLCCFFSIVMLQLRCCREGVECLPTVPESRGSCDHWMHATLLVYPGVHSLDLIEPNGLSMVQWFSKALIFCRFLLGRVTMQTIHQWSETNLHQYDNHPHSVVNIDRLGRHLLPGKASHLRVLVHWTVEFLLRLLPGIFFLWRTPWLWYVALPLPINLG